MIGIIQITEGSKGLSQLLMSCHVPPTRGHCISSLKAVSLHVYPINTDITACLNRAHPSSDSLGSKVLENRDLSNCALVVHDQIHKLVNIIAQYILGFVIMYENLQP